jgi:hypothetical protein
MSWPELEEMRRPEAHGAHGWVAYPSKATFGPTVLAEHQNHVHIGYDGPLGPHRYSPGTPPCLKAALTGDTR